MTSPYLYAHHAIGHDIAAETGGTLRHSIIESLEVNRRLNEFIQQHADVDFEHNDVFGIGRNFPYLGHCLDSLQWAEESIFVAYTGRHNLIVSRREHWPLAPCRKLTAGEFGDVMRSVTTAYHTSLRTEIGQTKRGEMINAEFRRLFRSIQRLRIA